MNEVNNNNGRVVERAERGIKPLAWAKNNVKKSYIYKKGVRNRTRERASERERVVANFSACISSRIDLALVRLQ